MIDQWSFDDNYTTRNEFPVNRRRDSAAICRDGHRLPHHRLEAILHDSPRSEILDWEHIMNDWFFDYNNPEKLSESMDELWELDGD